jgi:hypothetical protein
MDKTRKLMGKVIASILFFSPTGLPFTALAQDLPRQKSPESRSGKSDNDVPDEETSGTVLFQLSCVKEQAKTIDKIVTELPRIKRKIIEASIKNSLDDDELVRIGQGTQKDPFRYFRVVGCGT